jgi:hypothetical protein
MRFERFIPTFVLSLVVGVAAFLVGCGPGGDQGSSSEKAPGKVIAEDRKEAQKERKSLQKANRGGRKSAPAPESSEPGGKG